ncbi:MAG TPA: S-layer homology domain-containing protein [Syntrophomonadaceae bacterium]|nr:S-layer homology domain-containing protein [Syntrophomonadaceae bacterium]
MKKTLIILMLCILTFVYSQNALAIDFKDTSNHWAQGYINELSNHGYLQGYGDGNFYPDKIMTRAEFVSALLRCANNSPAYNYTNTSYSSGHWADAQINEATRQNIIVLSEYPQGFNKDNSINRAEASAMVVRTLGKQPVYSFASFKDNNTVNNNPYAGYIKVAQQEGIITGYPDGEFKPYNYITRAQASIILSRFMTIFNTTSPYYDPYSPTTPQVGGITNPSSTRIASLSLDGYRYNPEYLDIYIDNRPSIYYLSDAEIISANLLRIGGRNYNLNDNNLSLKLQNEYYTIDQVYWVNGIATLNISKGRYRLDDYWTNIYLSDVDAVYDSRGNKVSRIDDIEFRARGKTTRYGLDEIEIDLYDDYIILADTKYKPNRVEIRVKQTNYSSTSWWTLEEVRVRNDRLVFDCDDYYDRHYDDFDYISYRDVVFIDQDDYEYQGRKATILIDSIYRNFTNIDILDRYEFEYDRETYDFIGSRIQIENNIYKINSTNWRDNLLKLYIRSI